MRKIISIIMLTCLGLLCSCGNEEKNVSQMNRDELNAAIMGVSNSGEGVRILQEETVTDCIVENENGKVFLECWKVGYGKTSVKFDIPAFLIKLNVTNDSDETLTIGQICGDIKIFVDGVEEYAYVGNIFSDTYESGHSDTDELRPGAAADYYRYVHTTPENEHTFEIIINDTSFLFEPSSEVVIQEKVSEDEEIVTEDIEVVEKNKEPEYYEECPLIQTVDSYLERDTLIAEIEHCYFYDLGEDEAVAEEMYQNYLTLLQETDGIELMDYEGKKAIYIGSEVMGIVGIEEEDGKMQLVMMLAY